MKNIWKWVLGIVLTLVLVALAVGLFGLGFFVRTRTADLAPRNIPAVQMDRFPDWRGDRMDMPRGPMMMRGFRRGPFLPGMMFFGFVGRIVPLALFGLLLYGAYRLGKGRSAPLVAPVAVSETSPAPSPTTHPCSACGTTVHDDWKHCPNCGEKQETGN